jgi:hypothetical protein
MNPTLYAARLGLARGWAECRQSLTDPQQLGFNVIFAVAFVIVLLFQRDSTVEGTNVSLAFAVLPGVLGMMVALADFRVPRDRWRSNVRTGRCCGPRRYRTAWSATSPAGSCRCLWAPYSAW